MENRLRFLFQRYLDNTCTYNELEEFFAYIRKAENDESLRHLIKQVYAEMEGESRGTFVDENGRLVLTEPATSTTLPKRKRRKRPVLLLTVMLFLAMTAIGGWWFTIPGKTLSNATGFSSLTKKTTDRSEYKLLMLKDSTEVWLNAASSLEFPDEFDEDKREVFLTGEAYFDVKHADKIPFIIHTGAISTKVLGTAFNIKAYPGQKNITVSVSRGKVEVSDKEGWKTTLMKGEQVKVGITGKEIIEKAIPVSGIAAWQQGRMVYEDETLQNIIADMERVYNVTIRLDNTTISELQISTSFKKEIGIGQALDVLCKLTEAELKQIEGVYFIQ